MAPPEMLPGDVFAFVVQAKATGQAKEISAVLHAPELKLLLWEPLLLTLKAPGCRIGVGMGGGLSPTEARQNHPSHRTSHRPSWAGGEDASGAWPPPAFQRA